MDIKVDSNNSFAATISPQLLVMPCSALQIVYVLFRSFATGASSNAESSSVISKIAPSVYLSEV